MYKPESVLENEMHKIHWGFEIQTNYIISVGKPDIEKKRTYRIVEFEENKKEE